MSPTPLRIAAVQAAPVYLDLGRSVDKALALIAQAAREGARLVAFPELWLPGYPWWIWLDEPAWAERQGLTQRYLEQAMAFGGEAERAIAAAAREHGLLVLMGLAERESSRLYITQWLVDETGHTVFRRRKLKPGPLERLVFAEGGARDLRVADTSIGRVGALACAEHRHTLLKHALHVQSEDLHVASWPGFALARTPGMLAPETFLSLSRSYAVEGGCYVLAPCAPVTAEVRALLCDTPAKAERLLAGGAYAQIFAPDGQALCEPLAPDAEGLLLAEVSPAAIAQVRRGFDLAGHSARADVLQLLIQEGTD